MGQTDADSSPAAGVSMPKWDMGWGVQAGWLSEQACLAVDEDRHRDVRQKEQQNRRVHEPHGSDRLLYTSICSPMPITGWGCTN